MPTANGQGAFYIDSTINQYLAKGVPARKMVLGIPFYGYGWKGVPNVNGGLNQTATGPADDPGGLFGANSGTSLYRSLATSCPVTGYVAGQAESYCNGSWWAYETPATVAIKTLYKTVRGLGGVYFWELRGDSASGTLVSTLYNFR
jgi:chitinase